MKVAAIVPAAGQGKRLGSKIPKPYLRIFGTPLLVHTVKALQKAFSFEEIVVVAESSFLKKAELILKGHGLKKARVVTGGASRAESVLNGLKSLKSSAEYVLVHDAARPLISKQLVRRTILGAKKAGAICGIPVSSTVKCVSEDKDRILGTQDRRFLYLAQTPQVFKTSLLMGRYQALGKKALAATDEASLFDGSDWSIRMVAGDPQNIKVTTKADLELMKHYLGSHANRYRL